MRKVYLGYGRGELYSFRKTGIKTGIITPLAGGVPASPHCYYILVHNDLTEIVTLVTG